MKTLENHYREEIQKYSYITPMPPPVAIAGGVGLSLVGIPTTIVGLTTLAGGSAIGLLLLSVLLIPFLGSVLALADLIGRRRGTVTYPMSWTIANLFGGWVTWLPVGLSSHRGPTKPNAIASGRGELESPDVSLAKLLLEPRIDINPCQRSNPLSSIPDTSSFKYEWSLSALVDNAGKHQIISTGFAKDFVEAKRRAEAAQEEFLGDKGQYIHWKMTQGALLELDASV